jgi:hypothetical protein
MPTPDVADLPYTGPNLGPLRPLSGSDIADPFAQHFGDAPPADVKSDAKAAKDDSANYDHAFSDKPPTDQSDQPAPREVDRAESAVKGLGNALTFGASPAIAGLAEASGIPSAATNPDEIDLNPVRPIVGAAKLLHNYLSDHPDPEVQAAYDRGRKSQVNDEQLAQEQHPAAYIAGQLGGALLVPMGAAGEAAGLAARTGRSLVAGGVGGGLYGAGDAVGHGQDAATALKEAGKGALTGAAFGGIAGAGGHVIGQGIDKGVSIARGTRDVDAEAGRRVVDALTSDMESQGPQLSRPQIAAANAAGTPRAIVDTGGERTRALARSSANTSPEGRQALTELTQNRFEDQAPRVGGFIRRITGGANADADTQVLQNAAKIANKPAYAKAYAKGAPGIWHQGLAQLLKSPDFQVAARDATRTGANKAAAQGFTPVKNPFAFGANGQVSLAGNARPNLQFWDAVKQNLDDKIGAAMRAGEKGHAADLLALKNQLVSHLDAAVPEYKAARQGAAAFFGAEDALEAGQKFVMSNANINEARRAISKMSGPEKELFARGFASDLADKIERTGDNRNVLNSIFLNNGPARQKINIALGAARADQLEALLRAEHVVDQARKALGNSTTARQLAESGLAGGGAVAAFEGLKEHDFNPVHVLTAALTFGAIRHGAKVIDGRVARRVGEMLASSDASVLQKGIKIVATTPAYLDALRRATAAGVRIGAQDIGFDNAAAGAATLGQRILRGPDPEAPDHTPENPYDLPMQ